MTVRLLLAALRAVPAAGSLAPEITGRAATVTVVVREGRWRGHDAVVSKPLAVRLRF